MHTCLKNFIGRMRTRSVRFLYAAPFVPLAEYPANSRLANIYQGTDLSQFVNSAFKFAISIGAILAVLRLAYAGYMYMGSDMWSSKGKAREIIGDVVLGLLLLLAVFLIFNQINPGILKLDILKGIQSPTSSADIVTPYT